MCHPRMCVDKWRPTASMLCLLSLPCKKVQVVSPMQLCSKQSSKGPSPENFVTIAWWLFWTLHVSRYGTVKLSEGKRQDTSCGGQICISLSHKFVLSCMCGHYILVYKYNEANRVYSVVKIATHRMCLGVFPCDILTAKCCKLIEEKTI